KRKKFNVKLNLKGTVFELKVWHELIKIPFGSTASYCKIAERIGKPKAARAVGNACRKNPIPIIVPCHRIVAKNGSLGGFSGGLWRKEWLLKHELKHS
ncbi:MAG: methylated-DNA--[protein]-cysteine S-methyltransferase, partial [Elusimicrobiota bacterium]